MKTVLGPIVNGFKSFLFGTVDGSNTIHYVEFQRDF